MWLLAWYSYADLHFARLGKFDHLKDKLDSETILFVATY